MIDQPNTNEPDTNEPNQNPSEDQNLGGDTEVNPGKVGTNTEVDLDKTQINTYEGDKNSPSPTKH